MKTPSSDDVGDAAWRIDSSPVAESSRQFADVGSGLKARDTDDSRESAAVVSRLLNSRHTFTHHLYHHYDLEPASHRRQHQTTSPGITLH